MWYPRRSELTSPAARNTRRCCETAPCVTSSRAAIAPTHNGPVFSNSTIRTRTGAESVFNRSASLFVSAFAIAGLLY